MKILPGMSDTDEQEYSRQRQIKDDLQAFFSLYGYSIIDTPILERADTFVRKSAEEVSYHLYTFADRDDNRISLRPEFTSGVIRSFIENEATIELPARWQYSGPVFRFENNKRREFTQIAIELLGTSSPKANCDVIALATQSLAKLGITGQEIVIGHMGAIRELLLQLDLSTRGRSFLLASMLRLKQSGCTINTIMEEARRIGILQDSIESSPSQYDISSIPSLDWDKLFLGNRPQEEIIDRLARKAGWQSERMQIERGLALIESLSKLQARPDKVLEDARRVVKEIGFKDDPFKDLEESLELLNYHNLGDATVTVDLGLTRDATYYTGLIFEIKHQLLPERLSLAGGGRYDRLIRAMGGKTDTPAAGFAFALDSLISILENDQNTDTRRNIIKTTTPTILSKTPDSYGHAIKLADSRRLNGNPAEVHFDEGPSDIDKIITSGDECKDIIVVDKDGNVEEYKVGK